MRLTASEFNTIDLLEEVHRIAINGGQSSEVFSASLRHAQLEIIAAALHRSPTFRTVAIQPGCERCNNGIRRIGLIDGKITGLRVALPCTCEAGRQQMEVVGL